MQSSKKDNISLNSGGIILGDSGSEFKQEMIAEIRKTLNRKFKLPPCEIARACQTSPIENPRGCAFYKDCIQIKKLLII